MHQTTASVARDLHTARPDPRGREVCAVCSMPVRYLGGGGFRHVAQVGDVVTITRERGAFRVTGVGADLSLTCWGPLGSGRERARSFTATRVKTVKPVEVVGA